MDLSPSDVLGIMVAARTDKATTERLAQIHEALKAHDEAKAKAAALVEEATQARIDATRIKAEAEAMRQTLVAKQTQLEDFERTLSDHNQELIAEKAEFEKVRRQVYAEQKAEASRMAVWDDEIVKRQDAVMIREKSIAGRESKQAGREASLDELEADLLEVLQKHGKLGEDAA